MERVYRDNKVPITIQVLKSRNHRRYINGDDTTPIKEESSIEESTEDNKQTEYTEDLIEESSELM